ncbi:BREX system P-loop protein BrxC [Akkermansia muciniphila]|uniref:BREX system P-loop protein BrxC n=1 Tax=Akkermansia muciniphila TaxID=239935 RepID=UPI001BFF0793|nr:BREX system P-loop protein BrxC [Akkermansia muciniphila]MBT8777649.1 BREX system P-loop protein BrxC [Akkermansia muciniphila]
MKNRDIYLKDPAATKLANEGVADVDNINDEILRYELETFVCDGQYAKGLTSILQTFLTNMGRGQQPAFWVSGFFGSGKSHLLKMLGVLWENRELEGYGKPREIASQLPQEIKDAFQEIDIKSRRKNLHVVMGTLTGEARGSVRLAFLKLVLKSKGLPADYSKARFTLFLKQEGWYEDICNSLASQSTSFEKEIEHLRVSTKLHEALSVCAGGKLGSHKECRELIKEEYKEKEDVNNDEMIDMIRTVLSSETGIPLTLFILDEVQQFIGDHADRGMVVQEIVEECAAKLGSDIMFICSGQTAITGTPNLQKLAGRFPNRIELSDADADAVIRKVILQKKPDAVPMIRQTLNESRGEISRHLSGSSLAARHEDESIAVEDYPMLPTRRRLWDYLIRTLDQTGAQGQLRNQLKLVFKALRSNLDEKLGQVVPADFLFFDMAPDLMNAQAISRDLYEFIMKEKDDPDSSRRLMARACAIVYLINKLPPELHVRANVNAIADLLVSDLAEGSSAIRKELPDLLNGCPWILKMGDEYRIQTKASLEWREVFTQQRQQIANDAARIQNERSIRLEQYLQDLSLPPLKQGESQCPRSFEYCFQSKLPRDAADKIYIMVRDGWTSRQEAVLQEARAARPDLSSIYVFLPEISRDKLNNAIRDFMAARDTLNIRTDSADPEAQEARNAMRSLKAESEQTIKTLLQQSLDRADVYLAGGEIMNASSLREALVAALKIALDRLYPHFGLADSRGWDKVFEKAKKGDQDALQIVGFRKEVDKHPVCEAILRWLSQERSGHDVRKYFEASPFGWPRDAVDSALVLLFLAGKIRARAVSGRSWEAVREMDRREMGQASFKSESITITTLQKMEISALWKSLGMENLDPQKLLERADEFKAALNELVRTSGGEPPCPEVLQHPFLRTVSASYGNELLSCLLDHKSELRECIAQCQQRREEIRKAEPAWKTLQSLLKHASSLPGSQEIANQCTTMVQERSLLLHSEAVRSYSLELTRLLSSEIGKYFAAYSEAIEQGEESLALDETWQGLSEEKRGSLLARQGLTQKGSLSLPDVPNTPEQVLSVLEESDLSDWDNRVRALPERYKAVLLEAARLLAPQAHPLSLPHKIISSPEDAEQWLNEARAIILSSLATGPVRL